MEFHVAAIPTISCVQSLGTPSPRAWMQGIINTKAAMQRQIDIRVEKGTHFRSFATCFHICRNYGRRLFSSGCSRLNPNSIVYENITSI
jgi:hypothetical protein